MNTHTSIIDVDHKLDIIDHINQDHLDEILIIAINYFENVYIEYAIVSDIFEEGIQISFKLNNEKKIGFIPFEIDGHLEDRILYLAYVSFVNLGKEFSGTRKQFFEILESRRITKNIVRLTVASEMPLPEYYPGYTYGFALKIMKKKVSYNEIEREKKHWFKNFSDKIFVWLIKRLSRENREKLIYSTYKNVRLYTLRKSWKSDSAVLFCDRGEIDVYTHGESLGSLWVDRLCVGDVIFSRSKTPDNHPHLISGQAFMIVDEAGYSSLAGILEQWVNPIPPMIILVSANKEEQGYFVKESFPPGSLVYRVICHPSQQGDKALEILKTLGSIDVVWGALESSSAKQVRHYLRNERLINGKNNHIKAYWDLKSRKS
ncbi:siderophore-interacting protein [Vibrio sp. WJH972]